MSHTPKTTCLCTEDSSACQRLGQKLAIARLALRYIREKLTVADYACIDVEVIDLLCLGAALATGDVQLTCDATIEHGVFRRRRAV